MMELIECDINNLMNIEEGSQNDFQRVQGRSACRSGVDNGADVSEVPRDNDVVQGISISEGVDVLEEAMVEFSNLDHDEIRPGYDCSDDRQDMNQPRDEVEDDGHLDTSDECVDGVNIGVGETMNKDMQEEFNVDIDEVIDVFNNVDVDHSMEEADERDELECVENEDVDVVIGGRDHGNVLEEEGVVDDDNNMLSHVDNGGEDGLADDGDEDRGLVDDDGDKVLKPFTPDDSMVARLGPYIPCQEVPCKAIYQGKLCKVGMLLPSEGTWYKGHQCLKCKHFYHSICVGESLRPLSPVLVVLSCLLYTLNMCFICFIL